MEVERFALYMEDIARPILEELVAKTGKLQVWYKESRNECIERPACYVETDWFLSEKVLACFEIRPESVMVKAFSRKKISVVECHYRIRNENGKPVRYLDQVQLYFLGERKELILNPPQDTRYYKSYTNLVNELNITL